MTIENANDHPFKVAIVKDADLFANSHPFKVYVEGGGSGAEARVVDELPEEGESGYIYLVLKEQTEEGDIYDEYIWALQSDGETYGWEHLGATNEVTIVLYSTPGTNTDGAMTQNAATSMVFADPADRTKVQIGNSTTSGLNSVVIGNNLEATGTRTIAMGDRTDNTVVTASGASGISIGVNTSSTAGNGVAIGVRANASGDGAVALGTYASASGQYSFAMHYLANASGESSVALGVQSVASQQDSIAIGCKADASGLQGIAIGRVAEGSGKWSTCVGVRAKARGYSSSAVGSDAISEGERGTAIGSSAQANATGSVAIGAHSRATQVGQVDIGSDYAPYGYGGSSYYRLLTGLYDPQNAHDGANKQYVDNLVVNYSAIKGNAAPTSATEAKYVGQLYVDTTAGKLYYCANIEEESDESSPYSYNWLEVGNGGGGNVSIFYLTTPIFGRGSDISTPIFYTDTTYQNTVTSSVVYDAFMSGPTYICSVESDELFYSQIVAANTHDDNYEFSISNAENLLGANCNISSYIMNNVEYYSFSYKDTPSVVQAPGNNTLAVMSQDATTSMVFADPATRYKVKIGYGSSSSGDNAISIGRSSAANADRAISIGYSSAAGDRAIAIGGSTGASGNGSIALGYGALAQNAGQVSVGTSYPQYGYNNSNYRLISGVYDGQSAHDAATKGQLDSIAIQNAGTPTASTVGTVGQLLEDTTNGKLYICADATNPYVWEEVGAGGSGPTVVQTTGSSTTDVMSQDATTKMVFKDGNTSAVCIGNGADASTLFLGTAVGKNAKATGTSSVAFGSGTNAPSDHAIAIGGDAFIGGASHSYSVAIGSSIYAAGAIGIRGGVQGKGGVAIGYGSSANTQGQFDIGSNYDTAYGYNNTNYRLLTGLYDPQSAHDAATKGYVDGLVGNVASALNIINNGTGA